MKLTMRSIFVILAMSGICGVHHEIGAAESAAAANSTAPLTRDASRPFGNPPPSPLRPVDPGDFESLDASLSRLRSMRQQVNATAQATQSRVTHAGSSRHPHVAQLTQAEQQFSDAAATEQRRAARLRQKLDRLKQFVDQSGICAPEATPAVDAAAEQNGSQPSTEDERATSAENEPPDETPTPAAPPTTAAATEWTSLPSTPIAPFLVDDPLEEQQVSGVPVLEEPVDRLALANNLYGTGELTLALEIYQKLDRTGLPPSSQLWIDYQIANCHRRLGNRSDAERAFRIVTSRDRDSWISENSRWWLDVEDKSSRLQQRLNDVQQSLSELQETLDDSPNPR